MAGGRRTAPTLLVIGGAEDRVGKATVLRRFVRLAGGRPTSSSPPVTGAGADLSGA